MRTLAPSVVKTSSFNKTGSSEFVRSRKPIKTSAGRKVTRTINATIRPRTLAVLLGKELLMRAVLANDRAHSGRVDGVRHAHNACPGIECSTVVRQSAL